jgi:hypothetical protein
LTREGDVNDGRPDMDPVPVRILVTTSPFPGKAPVAKGLEHRPDVGSEG